MVKKSKPKPSSAAGAKLKRTNLDHSAQRMGAVTGAVKQCPETKRGRSIAITPGVHGVALAPGLNRGFTSNGGGNTVTVFELSSLKVLATLPAWKKPDAIAYDPFTKRVFAANGESGMLDVSHTQSQLPDQYALRDLPSTGIIVFSPRLLS